MKIIISRILLGLSIIFLGIGRSYPLPSEPKDERLPIEVRVEVDKDHVTIGDKIRYTITVNTDKDIEVEFPDPGRDIGGFVIKNFDSSKRTFWRRKRLIQWYILYTYDTGRHTIPKVVIRYKRSNEKEWKNIEGNEIEIEVRSLLDKDKEDVDIRDIKGPITPPFMIDPYLIAGILAFLLIGGVVGVLLLRKKREVEESSPSIIRSAHEIAFERLEELKKGDLIKQNRIKDYYIELSDIVRHYIEDRFNLRAPEMSTEEFLGSLKGSQRLSYLHKDLLREFLSHCDLVKFARYDPTESEMRTSLELAFRLVQETKERGEPEP